MGKSKNGKELGANIRQRADGRFEGRFVNRFGKRQCIYGKTYNETVKKLRDALYEDEHQINVVTTQMTLDEWYQVWIETCKKHCRNTTKRTYANQYNRIHESLGWRKLSKLNLVVIQQAFNELESDSSRGDCKALLVDMLNRAMEADLIQKNYAIGVKTVLDNKEKLEKRILTPEEIRILYNISYGGQLYPLFVLALNSGLRIGEVLGLTWDCVHFESEMITVNKTLVYLPNDGKAIYEFHKPKTEAGKRKIPMTPLVKEVLLKQKKWREKVNDRFDPVPGFEDLVFTSKTNHVLNETNIRTSINYMITKINREYPEINFKPFTFHCLRHTFATECIARGMKPKVLQKILGHQSLQMTMDLYCHVREDTLKEEMLLFMAG